MIENYRQLARFAPLLFLFASACSEASTIEQATGDNAENAAVASAPPIEAVPPAENNAAPVSSADASRIIAKKDIILKGKPSCKIDFAYPGYEPEDLLWDGEACSAVTAEMMDQAGLEKLGKWERLDAFEKKHITDMPGGKVLYVEGAFTASVYPVGTTRMSYEVPVAD